jgi:hypothetical protein
VIKWVVFSAIDAYQGDIAHPVHTVFLSCLGEWWETRQGVPITADGGTHSPATISIAIDINKGTVNYEGEELHFVTIDNDILANGYPLGGDTVMMS